MSNERNETSGQQLPQIVALLFWILDKNNWRTRPVVTTFVALVQLATILLVFSEIAKIWKSWRAYDANHLPPASVTWHRISGVSESCDDYEAFLTQVCEELPGGAEDPLDRIGNSAMQLRSQLEGMRGSELRRYADYFVFYSSPIGGGLLGIAITVNDDINAVVGVRLFEIRDSQIVALGPVQTISNDLVFSDDNLRSVDRVLVFIFPLTADAAEVIQTRGLTENATIEWER